MAMTGSGGGVDRPPQSIIAPNKTTFIPTYHDYCAGTGVGAFAVPVIQSAGLSGLASCVFAKKTCVSPLCSSVVNSGSSYL